MPKKPEKVAKKYGRLVVRGEDSAEVELPWVPDEVGVEFLDDPTDALPSCDLKPNDFLSAEVIKYPLKGAVLIKWRVTGVREIKWIAKKRKK